VLLLRHGATLGLRDDFNCEGGETPLHVKKIYGSLLWVPCM